MAALMCQVVAMASLTLEDPSVFDGNPRYLTDSAGKRIVPGNFARINYCGNGLFILAPISPTNKFLMSAERFLIDRDGKPVTYKIPKGSTLFDVLTLGEQLDLDMEHCISTLPDETLLRFVEAGRSGVCDKYGNVLVELRSGPIGLQRPGVVLFAQSMANGTQFLVLDSKSKKTALWSDKDPGFDSRTFKLQREESRGAMFTQVTPDRIVREINQPWGTADRIYWADATDYPVKRIQMFNRFLRQYNLIGMDKERLLEELGEKTKVDASDGSVLSVPPLSVHMRFEQDKLVSWYFTDQKHNQSQLITKNVVLDLSGNSDAPRDFPALWRGEFPATEPKL